MNTPTCDKHQTPRTPEQDEEGTIWVCRACRHEQDKRHYERMAELDAWRNDLVRGMGADE